MGMKGSGEHFAVVNAQQSGRLSCLSGLSLYFSAPITSWRLPFAFLARPIALRCYTRVRIFAVRWRNESKSTLRHYRGIRSDFLLRRYRTCSRADTGRQSLQVAYGLRRSAAKDSVGLRRRAEHAPSHGGFAARLARVAGPGVQLSDAPRIHRIQAEGAECRDRRDGPESEQAFRLCDRDFGFAG